MGSIIIMSSTLLRTVKYTSCAVASLPSCSTWGLLNMLSRHIALCSPSQARNRSFKAEPVIVKRLRTKKKIIDIYTDMTVR